jgi:hypothetical protein
LRRAPERRHPVMVVAEGEYLLAAVVSASDKRIRE